MMRIERIEYLLTAVIRCLQETEDWYRYTTIIEREVAMELTRDIDEQMKNHD